MSQRRVESDLQAQSSARRQRQTRTPVAPAQTEPTNVDDTQAMRPVSDGQLFSEPQLKHLNDSIATGIMSAPILVRSSDSGLTSDYPLLPQVMTFVCLGFFASSFTGGG